MAPIQKSHEGPTPASSTYATDPPTTGTIPKSARGMAGPPPSHAPAHLNPALLSSSTSGVSSEANISQPNSADYEGSWPPPAPPQNLFLERIREQQDKLKSLRAQHWQMLQQTPDSRTRSLAGGPPSGPPPLALGGSGSWEAGPRLDRTRGGDGSAAESAFPNQASVMVSDAFVSCQGKWSLMVGGNSDGLVDYGNRLAIFRFPCHQKRK